jgi:hypothetical protein
MARTACTLYESIDSGEGLLNSPLTRFFSAFIPPGDLEKRSFKKAKGRGVGGTFPLVGSAVAILVMALADALELETFGAVLAFFTATFVGVRAIISRFSPVFGSITECISCYKVRAIRRTSYCNGGIECRAFCPGGMLSDTTADLLYVVYFTVNRRPEFTVQCRTGKIDVHEGMLLFDWQDTGPTCVDVVENPSVVRRAHVAISTD